MELEIIAKLKSIFYENYYKHFLLSNLPKVDELYIPVSGSEFDNTSATTAKQSKRKHVEDIQAKIISSVSTIADDKSFVISGDGGTGKTTLALSIVHEYWKRFRTENAAIGSVIIPLYIHLPQLLRFRQSSQRIDILRSFYLLHFSNLNDDKSACEFFEVITDKYQLLLVLDEYENFVDKRNLWHANNFGDFDVKTIIFSRPEAFNDSEFYETFSYKFEGTKHNAKHYSLLTFASVQISSYLLKVVEFLRNLDPAAVASDQLNEPWLLTKDTTKVKPIWERDSSEYRHWFELILPELGELSRTPFVLCLLVQVLPTIVEEYRRKPSQSSFDMELVQLVSTEVGIYDQFTRRWFDYSSNKILQIQPKMREIKDSLPHLLEIYSNNLALRFFNKKQGYIGDGKFPRKLTEEWDLWKLNDNWNRPDGENIFDEIDKLSLLFPKSEQDFNENEEKRGHLIALRSGCLLRYFNFQSQGENYMFQFLHSSLLEYFVSRTIFKGLRAELNFHMKKIIGVQSARFSFGCESIRSAKYVGILQMLVERTRTDIDFKRLLLSVVRTSKDIASLSVMSSNAFTILTHAYRVWCNEDFSYVNIADADMSHCVFVNCEFRGADMSKALMTGTFFYKSHLQAANLFYSHIARGLNFDLQEGIDHSDRKVVKQLRVFESAGSNKVQITYSNRYGLKEMYLYDVNKKTTKAIFGPPKWSVLDYRKLQPDQSTVLVALQSGDKSQSGQTLCIYDLNLKRKTKVLHLEQTYLEDDKLKFQSSAKNVRLSPGDDGDVVSNPVVVEIFTITIPNYGENIVCYRENDSPITAASFYFSLTTSPQPFNFTIQTVQTFTGSFFTVYQSEFNCKTLLATSSNPFVTIVDLQDGRVLFQMPRYQPQQRGQIVVTFIRFSPDGRYLLFDMGNTLYIVTLLDNAAEGVADLSRSDFSLNEISLLGSKDAFDFMLSCDFSTMNSNQPIAALVFSHGNPLIIDLVTGQKLQSIKMYNKCESLTFIGGRDSDVQLACTSAFGALSTHKIHSNHTGDPRSVQALNPRTDFHSLVDTKVELVDIYVSLNGKYMAVVKQNQHEVFKTADISGERIFCLVLFKIDGNSGKRTFVFNHTFGSLALRDIQVSFINEKFLCLIYPTVFKVFRCKAPYLYSCPSNDPVSVQILCRSHEKMNFEKYWHHERSQQIVVQQDESFVLENYSIEISGDDSSILLDAPRYRLDLRKFCRYSGVKIFFHVNESDNFAFIFPLGQWLCFIWNLNSGSVLSLSTNELESPHIWEEIKHVSTTFVDDGFPAAFFIDFSVGRAASFQGVVNKSKKTFELKKIAERTVYELIEYTNYFLSFCTDNLFVFGIKPSTSLFAFNHIHSVEGFRLMPVTINSENFTVVRLLAWNSQSISCIEINLSAMEVWKGDKYKFTSWQLLWCDPPNDQFSLLLSNTTNTVLGRDENWDVISKRFVCEGKVSRLQHSFTSLSSLYEQVYDNPQSIFSRQKDLLLSDDDWILLVIARKKGICASRLVNINVLQVHSGIIIEGIRHGRHFAFRADLFINDDDIYEITLAPLKKKKEKYFKLHKRYAAAEFPITSYQGELIIEKILADKQSEIAYHRRYQNCNSWVKSLLALIGIDVERKLSFVDLSNDFYGKKEAKGTLNFPLVTGTGSTF